MRRVLRTFAAFGILLSVALVVNVAPAGATSSHSSDSRYKHIFYIMMENHSTDEIFGNTADAPYINQLASQYAISTDYFGVTHPSLPNYLAAISGNFQNIWDDCKAGPTVKCAPEEFGPDSGYTNGQELLTPAQIAQATNTPHWFTGATIVDQLEAHGLTWKAYMQSIPFAGYTGEYYPFQTVNGQQVPVKLYAQKHDPFMYFSTIRNNPSRLNKVVPFTHFAADLKSGNVPNFVWISPDQCHDMHGVSTSDAAFVGFPTCAYPASGLDHGAIQLGDAFLQSTVTAIMGSQAWHEKSAIVIAWDENDYSSYAGCCHSPTGVNGAVLGGSNAPLLVITSKNPQHFVDSIDPYNHYSLLATIQDLWKLGCLDNSCGFSNSELMTHFFV
ncbi:MAG TPA: alkaline phosphatase family protein [Ktedonobacteraceae bacterium]|nr:alkaline phosphatase family protein [Ktedonobacteraceae bacterium]